MSNRNKFIIGVVVLVLLGGGVVAKLVCFPTIRNVWFQLDRRQLAAAPANLVVFRETCLANRKAGCQMAWMRKGNTGNNYTYRYSGRNVPLQEIIPLAYQCNPSDVVMPPEAPTRHYDFLITVMEHPNERLQQALEKQTGFTAGWQDRETEVWLLQVQKPGVLQPSTNTMSRMESKNGRLVCSHLPIRALTGFIGNRLSHPLKDDTQLSGFYDFSVGAGWLNQKSVDEETLRPLLAELGLSITETNAIQHMMVVHRK